jgi:hypothetical protein
VDPRPSQSEVVSSGKRHLDDSCEDLAGGGGIDLRSDGWLFWGGVREVEGPMADVKLESRGKSEHLVCSAFSFNRLLTVGIMAGV